MLILVSVAAIFAAQAPVYDIAPPKASHDNFLEGAIEGKIAAPYAKAVTGPFIYKIDFKNDGEGAFVVGGVNPTSRLRRLTSISGVELGHLDARMVANSARLPKRELTLVEKAWSGIGNVGIRRSNDGFLSSGEKLLERLIDDNDLVLGRGLSHQLVAEPLLKAIQAHESTQSEVEFEYGKKKFKVKPAKMAGDSFLYDLLKKTDPRRTNRSGWIGFGMQGSPFNDQIFANWYFEIVPLRGGKGLRGDALTSHLIYRYGFYQGGKYRMDPAAIIQFFGIQKTS